MWGYKLVILSKEGEELNTYISPFSLEKESAEEAVRHAKMALRKLAMRFIDFYFCKMYLYSYDRDTEELKEVFFGYYDAGINFLKEKEYRALKNKLRKEGK